MPSLEFPRTSVKKVQAALLWSGDFCCCCNGEDPLVAAIKNLSEAQQRQGHRPCSRRPSAHLLAAAGNHEQDMAGTSWLIRRPASASACRPRWCRMRARRRAARAWSSAHGDVQVETFRIAAAILKCPRCSSRKRKSRDAQGRIQRACATTAFFISGFQGLKKFSVKRNCVTGEVRGFTMMYDQMMERSSRQ